MRDALAAGDGDFAVLPGRLHAPAENTASVTSAAARREVGIIKANDTLRFGLRFRYDPAPEAGHLPLTLRASLERVAVKADGFRPSVFVLFSRIGGIAEP